MIGRQECWQEELFVAGPLSSLIPDNPILKQDDKVLDWSRLRDEVKDAYCCDNGRPGIDPEAAVCLMLAGFFQGIVHGRKLMREAQVNLTIRWFAGYRLDEKLTDQSSLTKIRQRLRNHCISGDVSSRSVLIGYVDEALLRARRRHHQLDDTFVAIYKRHCWRTEGMHGKAKTQHGLRRAVRRGLSNVVIQAYLTAAVIHLKRLAASGGLLFPQFRFYWGCLRVQKRFDVGMSEFLAEFRRNLVWKKAA